jgi:oligoendopeptidase F
MEPATTYFAAPAKAPRRFLPDTLEIDSWDALSPYFRDLEDRLLDSAAALERWLADLSELESVVQEHVGWLYIRMTCNTQDEELVNAYTYFINEINPHIEPCSDKLNRKLLDCPFRNGLDRRFAIHLRSTENEIRLFREENIPLNAELSTREQKYGEIAGAMSVEVGGKTLTLQQAANYLREPDRSLRQSVYEKIVSRRLQDREQLDQLFDDLLDLRHRIALQAGFSNYRDYKFVALNRFDYTADDCMKFHASVREAIVPLLEELTEQRRRDMELDSLKPWDLEVDALGRPDLKPFTDGKELMRKTIDCFSEIDPYFGFVARTLDEMRFIDLDSRIGKAPGGYNYPLYETGVPFIFMNASGSFRDVVTMVHEGGHAIHSMLTRDLGFVGFKELTSEIAELASMSMELISMEHWHHFFPDPEALRRAKREQLENVLEALPWIACIDRFQHWLYTHPGHTAAERTSAWEEVYGAFSPANVDWNGQEAARQALWQKQLHLFEVPFYYIEYGMAQLGAIALWRNYRRDPKTALEQYKKALSLGYTCPIPEVYQAAGIRFDFSESYIQELAAFVREELEKL